MAKTTTRSTDGTAVKFTATEGKKTYTIEAHKLAIVTQSGKRHVAKLVVDGEAREVDLPFSSNHETNHNTPGPSAQSGTTVRTDVDGTGGVKVTITRDDGTSTTITHKTGTTDGSTGSTTSTSSTDSNGNTTTTTTTTDGEGSTSTTTTTE